MRRCGLHTHSARLTCDGGHFSHRYQREVEGGEGEGRPPPLVFGEDRDANAHADPVSGAGAAAAEAAEAAAAPAAVDAGTGGITSRFDTGSSDALSTPPATSESAQIPPVQRFAAGDGRPTRADRFAPRSAPADPPLDPPIDGSMRDPLSVSRRDARRAAASRAPWLFGALVLVRGGHVLDSLPQGRRRALL